MTDKPITYHIIYGFAEGSWHGQNLRRTLEAFGYRYNPSVKKADVIIAHSGGCYLIPQTNAAKVILLIGLPYWPSKRLTKSIGEKVRHDYQDYRLGKLRARWFHKFAHNTRYSFTGIHRMVRMRQAHRRLNLPKVKPSQKIILIRNIMDSFAPVNITDLLPIAKTYTFRQMPGGHDDCWRNCQPYAELIKNYLS